MTFDAPTVNPNAGWYPNGADPSTLRWWDGNAWSDHTAPAQPAAAGASQATSGSAGSRNRDKGAALERQIARFIESLGYEVRTNVVLEGKSGSRHEIDVLGEKQDALSTFRVAVECKAWDQPIEKDVVAKFDWVLKDLGMREGIIVALGGMRAGAETAASEMGITLWGPEEIEKRLGAVAVADIASPAPKHQATGLPVVTTAVDAHAFFKRKARGTLGVGSETIAWTSLVWMPVTIVQLALSRTEGRIKRITQTRRIWNSYDRVTGGFVATWTARPSLDEVDIAGRYLRPKERETAPGRMIGDAVKKYSSVTTDAAKARHAAKLQSLGIPPGFAVSTETTISAFTPLYVAIAQRRGAERLIVVDANRNEMHPGLSAALSNNTHWLRESLGT